MTKRKSLSKKTRFDVFKRDGFVCQYCGDHPPKAVLHVDHIIAVVEGGENDVDNLVTSCEACNLGKGARPLASIPAALSERAALVAEREAQIRGYAEVMEAKRLRIEGDCWLVADIFVEQYALDGIRKDWFQSIRHFVESLGVDVAIRSMEVAVARMPWSKVKGFRYFCGVCWNRIREASA